MLRLTGWWSSHRPPSRIWAMSLLLLGASLRCVAGTGSRVAAGPSATVVTAVGVVCALLAVAVYVAGQRCPRSVIRVLLVVVIAVITLLVAFARDRADVALGALAYPWSALYAAHLLSRRDAFAYAGLTSAGFGAAIIAGGLPGLTTAWLLVTGTVGVVTAVTSTQVAALHRQSETDPLTGVSNRAGFRRLADQTLAATTRRGQSAALVLCDVDGLKTVNDARGHAAGDALLVRMVEGWQSVLRSCDVLARLGGDEFAVLMPDADRAGAEAVIERLRAATDVAFSAGIADWTPGTSFDVLLADADTAMYARKRAREITPAVPMQRPHPLQPASARAVT